MREAGTAALLLSCLVALDSAEQLAAQTVAPAVREDSSRSPHSAILTPSYTPHRVFDSRKKRFIDFETLAQRLAAADLVFVGEQHNDPATHRMELAILEGIARRRDSVVLAEMMDIDAGHISMASPLGQALKDRKPGEEVSLRLPTMTRKLRVIEVVTVHDQAQP